jgi:DNA-binding MarR family transcriptional regulator
MYRSSVDAEIARLEQSAFPALLREAQSAYVSAIWAAVRDAGYDGMSRSGIHLISAITCTEVPLSTVISHLGVSKQAAGQLVDALVTQGYLDRSVDPADRRRLVVALTGRGEAVAAVIRSTAAAVGAALEQNVGAEHVGHARATLAALIQQAQALLRDI